MVLDIETNNKIFQPLQVGHVSLQVPLPRQERVALPSSS